MMIRLRLDRKEKEGDRTLISFMGPQEGRRCANTKLTNIVSNSVPEHTFKTYHTLTIS